MVEALSHITLIVSDLDRAETLLIKGLGARKIYDSGTELFSHSEERFFLLGASDTYRDRLTRLGATILPDRSHVDGEGRSLYFYDHDNHLFELHTGTLDARMKRYAAGRHG